MAIPRAQIDHEQVAPAAAVIVENTADVVISPQRAEAIDRVLEYLKTANGFVQLPEFAVDSLLSALSWSYESDVSARPSVHYLTRQVVNASVELKLPIRPGFNRSLERKDDKVGSYLTWQIRDDSVRVRDIRTILAIEKQIDDKNTVQEGGSRQVGDQSLINGDVAYAKTEHIYREKEDILTDREAVVLRYLPSVNSRKELAKVFGRPEAEIKKLLLNLQNRLEIHPSGGRLDVYIELMLVAVALNEISLDNVPEQSQAVLNNLTEEQLEIIRCFYSPDRTQRTEIRDKYSSDEFFEHWRKIYKIFDVTTRQAAVLIAAKHGLLQLPDVDQIRKKLTRSM